jgi:hypothetical protein
MYLEVEERTLVTTWASHLYVQPPYYIFLDPPLAKVDRGVARHGRWLSLCGARVPGADAGAGARGGTRDVRQDADAGAAQVLQPCPDVTSRPDVRVLGRDAGCEAGCGRGSGTGVAAASGCNVLSGCPGAKAGRGSSIG